MASTEHSVLLGKHPTTTGGILGPNLMVRRTSLLLDASGLRGRPGVVGSPGAKMIWGLVLSGVVS